MKLSEGGHLTHGHAVNFSARWFRTVSYGVDPRTERIDFDALRRIAVEHKPRLIIAGATAYPRLLDFARFREIADEAGAHLMVDMAHIAGLVVSGHHPDPVPLADIVTSSSHKTLRGPRGGFILCRKAHREAVDRGVFPGVQGGPLMHVIAAKAIAFAEAMGPDFKAYGAQIVANARALADALLSLDFRLVSGGTENHLMLIDLSGNGITGRDAARALSRAGIILNKNTIPFDERPPTITSGIRLGTPAVTTRGMKEDEMGLIATLISRALGAAGDESHLDGIRAEVQELCDQFPIPG
jgi:glycine hydroxymethyltransferase